MDVAATISAVTAALGLVKEIRSIDALFDKAELKLKIADLAEALAEAKLGIIDIGQQLKDKDDEIARLKDLLQFKADNLVRQGTFSYFADEAGNPSGIPVCPVCEKKGLFLRLTLDRSKGAGGAVYVCPSCKANYGYNGVIARAPEASAD